MTNYNQRTIITLVLLPLFLSWFFAQTKDEPLADNKVGKDYYIQPAIEAPIIDGNLDEPAWFQIVPITDFLQKDPHNMAVPTEKTEVYLTYDDKNLYVAARLYDSEPSEIVRQLAPRDDWYYAFDEMADWLNISIDSRHDHQTGFSFSVNASGVICDAMIYNDENIDYDWNAIWEAEVQVNDLGWSLEIEIPFSNLSFYKGDKLTWGINITRFIQRKYETITWVTFPMEVEGIASTYGHLKGLEGIYPPSKFKFVPNFLGNTTTFSDIRLLKAYDKSYKAIGHKLHYINEPKADGGIDISYRLNPSSELMLSINPDFGQVEADPANVNLTVFETYFQEKRPFFIDDVDIFKTPIQIFYSRRIGESWDEIIIVDTTCSFCTDEATFIDTTFDYQIIPYQILTAGKWTGKTRKGLSYGFLGATTAPKFIKWENTMSTDSSDWATQMKKSKNRNYFVSRIKQDLFSGNSYIGFMNTSSSLYSYQTFAVDGMANLLDNQIGLVGQMVLTSDKHTGIFGSLSFSPPGNFSGWIDYQQYDKGIELNDLGFLWRDDYLQTKLGLQFQSFTSWNFVRSLSMILEGEMEENSDGLNLGKSIELSYDMKFTNYWELGGKYKKYLEAYNDRKIFFDDEESYNCCPSIYLSEMNEYIINVSTDPQQSISAFILLHWQNSLINDMYRGQFIELTYKPNAYLHFSISYDKQQTSMQYHFLETFEELEIDNSNHYMFAHRDGRMDAVTFRGTANINRKLSFHGYLEIFSNRDHYSEYVEYIPSTNEYDPTTNFILGEGDFEVPNFHQDDITPNDYAGDPMPVYTTFRDSVDLEHSYIDPNLELGFRPNLTSIRLNGILKWNYMKGSNLYIVYSLNKAVNGHQFNQIDQLGDFLTFNKREPWVEVLRDQTFMIKVDYWFEK